MSNKKDYYTLTIRGKTIVRESCYWTLEEALLCVYKDVVGKGDEAGLISVIDKFIHMGPPTNELVIEIMHITFNGEYVARLECQNWEAMGDD